MKKGDKLLTDLGLKKRKWALRAGDRRKNNRRYERVTSTKYSPDYQKRVKNDRRKGDRRK